jgi:putative FmdB family regulatory protein
MPTYDYECTACKHRMEEFQSFSDKTLTKCPVCKKKKLRRLIGNGAAVIFKGAGFYQTDYRSEAYTTAAKADEEAAKPAAKTDKTDTPTPAATPKSETTDAKSSKKK